MDTDDDNDGVSDIEEISRGTDPKDAIDDRKMAFLILKGNLEPILPYRILIMMDSLIMRRLS